MLKLSELKSILREYNIRPTKKLGQNFLIDKNIQKKMVEAINLEEEDTILEIGPGLGSLTEDLCKFTKKVIAVEKDKKLYEFLLENKALTNLELIHGDILKYNINDKSKIKIVGNLPYYISSPILIGLIKKRDFIKTIFITVQKEFADRLVAKPGNKIYGSISCFVQFYGEVTILFNIKKNAFYPAPKVDSCFLKISIRDKRPYFENEEKLFKIIRACFEKRRKTILNSLYSSGMFSSKEKILKALDSSGILPTQRPETISLEKFIELTNIFYR